MLQESSDQTIEFLHNTLKEFLAAERFFNVGDVRVLADRADDATWQPAILFALALQRDGSSFATDLVRALLEKTSLEAPAKGQSKQAKLQAAKIRAKQFFWLRCYTNAYQINDSKITAAFDLISQQLLPPRNMTDAVALASCGEAIVPYLKYQPALKATERAACVRTLGLIGDARANNLLKDYLNDPTLAVAQELVSFIDDWSQIKYVRYFDGELPFQLRWKLQNLNQISNLPNFTNLTSLNLDRTQVSDISALANLTSLTNLNLVGTQVSDISALANLTSLTNLNLDRTQVSDISALANLTSLTNLDLWGTQVSDISALANLTSLTSLNLVGTQMSDISALANLTSLTRLHLWGTQVSSDISALANLTNLTSLNLMGAQVNDISALANLTSLTRLDLWRTTQVNDISALANLTSLTSLNLMGTQVSDISALANLTNLTSLNLTRTQVNDISVLANLTSLTSLDLMGT
jgi:Leucine-rich repeat (LRR) protein